MCRQPLREAVSWNILAYICSRASRTSASSWGCELKYRIRAKRRTTQKSASSWGCELKYWQLLQNLLFQGQPLREAVSWNVLTVWKNWLMQIVSLFVRLWVEMTVRRSSEPSMQSASSWGCELKWWELSGRCSRLDVSLFVRLWVEIVKNTTSVSGSESASSWGCELKLIQKIKHIKKVTSASSWGCELKYDGQSVQMQMNCVSLFVRLWVELWLTCV